MAKNIWYKIPFQSQLGIDYELRIYKEGTPTSVTTLRAGSTPFTTDEDTSDDFFAPVRTQTGSISVIYEPGADFQTVDVFMAALMPESNIDTPVKLYKIVNSTETLVWQGFLSSELYTQQYISFAQEVTLPVISVLQAMDSVQITTAAVSGLMTYLQVIEKAINQMAATCDDYHYTQFTFPAYPCGGNISGKYIDTTILFEQKEYTNENSTTYIVSGLSCLEILKRLCAYMGWTCREDAQKLYITDPNQLITDSYTRRQIAYTDKLETAWSKDQESPDVEAEDMDDEFVYRGDGHEMGMAQGAKSVEVVAKVEKYNIDQSLPPFPYGETLEQYKNLYTNPTIWQYLLASLNTAPYQNVTLRFYYATISLVYWTQTDAAESTIQNVLSNRFGAEGIVDLYNGTGTARVDAGAFFAKVSYDSQQQASHKTQEGIYIVWLQKATADYNTQPIFSFSSFVTYNIASGYLKLSATMAHIVVNYSNDYETVWLTKEDSWEDKVLMHIRIGNMYWNGSYWQSTPVKVWVDIEGGNFKKNWTPSTPVEETDGYLIPLSNNSGQLEIAIYPQNNPTHSNAFLCETFFSQLSTEYVYMDDETTSDRSENRYYRLLGTNFSDEVSVGVDLASSLNNAPSPSLIMDDSNTPMTELNYGTTQSPDMRRPEVEMLNRLATYYSLPRRTVTIEAQHPTTAPLPLLRLNGYDSKHYLPLAESRDWQADKSTLTCMENPFPAAT